MTVLSFDQLEALWQQAGGQPQLAPTMAAIAEAESGGKTDALNAVPPDYSVGPWQINYYGSLYPSRAARYGTPDQLRANPLLDAKAAVDLAAGGAGLGNWSTYTSGAYQQYLAGAGSGNAASSSSGNAASGGGSVQTVSWWNPLDWPGAIGNVIGGAAKGAVDSVAGDVVSWLARIAASGVGAWLVLKGADRALGGRLSDAGATIIEDSKTAAATAAVA